jgi:hypothetical protein
VCLGLWPFGLWVGFSAFGSFVCFSIKLVGFCDELLRVFQFQLEISEFELLYPVAPFLIRFDSGQMLFQ